MIQPTEKTHHPTETALPLLPSMVFPNNHRGLSHLLQDRPAKKKQQPPLFFLIGRYSAIAFPGASWPVISFNLSRLAVFSIYSRDEFIPIQGPWASARLDGYSREPSWHLAWRGVLCTVAVFCMSSCASLSARVNCARVPTITA